MPSRFTRALNWLLGLTGTRKMILIIALALIIPVGFYVIQTNRDRISSFLSERRDQRHEGIVQEDTREADTHFANANSHGAVRQVKEDEFKKARAQQDEASQNSARTVAPTRRARRAYEETRRTPTRNMPSISDDDLCAEITRRGIECR